MNSPAAYDLAIVGAGIIGLAHAYHAHRRGLRVVVIDRGAQLTGASVQNFGHASITAQSGAALEFARAGRQHWLDLAEAADFWAAASGTYCLARADDEMQVMREFALTREPGQVSLLTRDEILTHLPIRDPRACGGMFMRDDLQVDPRTAAPAIAAWLERHGVDFRWRTSALTMTPGTVTTSRGPIHAALTFVTVNHDLDQLFPDLAEREALSRCRLHMLRARLPRSAHLPAPLLTGWSLLRYSGFAHLEGTAALAARLAAELPQARALDLHQMYTPAPDGSVLIGDTHLREDTAPPFQSEAGFDLLLTHARELFGVDEIDVIERWQGVYCSAPSKEFLITEPIERTHVVTVTTGIGMTTGMGLAEHTLSSALDGTPLHQATRDNPDHR